MVNQLRKSSFLLRLLLRRQRGPSRLLRMPFWPFPPSLLHHNQWLRGVCRSLNLQLLLRLSPLMGQRVPVPFPREVDRYFTSHNLSCLSCLYFTYCFILYFHIHLMREKTNYKGEGERLPISGPTSFFSGLSRPPSKALVVNISKTQSSEHSSKTRSDCKSPSGYPSTTSLGSAEDEPHSTPTSFNIVDFLDDGVTMISTLTLTPLLTNKLLLSLLMMLWKFFLVLLCRHPLQKLLPTPMFPALLFQCQQPFLHHSMFHSALL